MEMPIRAVIIAAALAMTGATFAAPASAQQTVAQSAHTTSGPVWGHYWWWFFWTPPNITDPDI